MQEKITCPKCNKSNNLKANIPFEAFIRASLNSKGDLETCDCVEKFTGTKRVFNFYSSEDGETRIFLIKKDIPEDNNVCIFCTKCSHTFQVKMGVIKI